MTSAGRHAPHYKYRPDIDGLRAIAVLSVVLFHAGMTWLSGGFVGVDIFFVISGYLITGILLGDPSIARFYIRRMRRILPALLSMLAVVTVAAVVVLLPADLASYGKSAASTVLFSSNLYFWRVMGYFQPGTQTMPLLHTWSLGVEEQYYILFPPLLILLRRVSDRTKGIVFALTGIISLLIAIAAMRLQQGNGAFYLLPSRAWELLAGATLASGVVPRAHHAAVRSVAGVTGLALVVWPIMAYTSATAFPGLAALPPVLGAVLLIWAGSGGPHLAGRLLTMRPLVWVGLVSYSFYLWHWPLLAFARYRLVRELSPGEGIGIALVALLAAWVSWRFVERPFRQGFTTRTIVTTGLGAMAVAVVASLVLVAADGLPARFSPQVVMLDRDVGDTWKCPIGRYRSFGGGLACPLVPSDGDPAKAQITLWGDSHAQMYAPAVSAAAGTTPSLLVNVYGCAPVKQVDFCGGRQRQAFDAVERSASRLVILAQNWAQYRMEAVDGARAPTPAEQYAPAIRRLDDTVAALRAAGKRVIVVAPIPSPDYEVPSVASRELAFFGHVVHPTGEPVSAYRAFYANVFADLRRLAATPGVTVLDLSPMLCRGGWCRYIDRGHSVLADYGHLSTAYAATLAPQFAQAIAAAGGDRSPAVSRQQ